MSSAPLARPVDLWQNPRSGGARGDILVSDAHLAPEPPPQPTLEQRIDGLESRMYRAEVNPRPVHFFELIDSVPAYVRLWAGVALGCAIARRQY